MGRRKHPAETNKWVLERSVHLNIASMAKYGQMASAPKPTKVQK
jgi:hypothetical protein